MKKTILNLLLLTIALNSCNKNSNSNNKETEKFGEEISSSNLFKKQQDVPYTLIDTKEGTDLDIDVLLKKIADDQEYVSLDSKVLIGNIDKVLVYKDIIYILDANIGEKIFIFNMNGRLIKSIESKGQGPKEYTGLADMNLDTMNNELIINDSRSPRLIHYTLDGNFLRKSPSKPSVEFAILNDDISLLTMIEGQSYNKNINYGLIVVKKDSVIRKGFQLESFQSSIPASFSMIKNSMGELLFTPIGSDTVYQILSDSAYKIRYVIGLKKSIWSYCKNTKDPFSNKKYKDLIIDDGYSCFSGRFFETDKFISFDVFQQPNSTIKRPVVKNYIYNKQLNELYSFDPFTKKDELYLKKISQIGSILPPAPISIYGNRFISVFPTEYMSRLKDACKDRKQFIKNNKFKQIIEQFPKEGNPVLVFYKFK